jgi:hypothetical protein
MSLAYNILGQLSIRWGLSNKECYEAKIILIKPDEIDQGLDILSGILIEQTSIGIHPLPLPWHATSRLLILWSSTEGPFLLKLIFNEEDKEN